MAHSNLDPGLQAQHTAGMKSGTTATNLKMIASSPGFSPRMSCATRPYRVPGHFRAAEPAWYRMTRLGLPALVALSSASPESR